MECGVSTFQDWMCLWFEKMWLEYAPWNSREPMMVKDERENEMSASWCRSCVEEEPIWLNHWRRWNASWRHAVTRRRLFRLYIRCLSWSSTMNKMGVCCMNIFQSSDEVNNTLAFSEEDFKNIIQVQTIIFCRSALCDMTCQLVILSSEDAFWPHVFDWWWRQQSSSLLVINNTCSHDNF